jgi:formate dehydrogenase subunit delta
MDTHHLVKMANSIGDFFQTEPDKAKAAKAVAGHIRSFWEPRMRRQIFTHIDETSGEGLSELVLAALRTHREELDVKKN